MKRLDEFAPGPRVRRELGELVSSLQKQTTDASEDGLLDSYRSTSGGFSGTLPAGLPDGEGGAPTTDVPQDPEKKAFT